MCVCAIYRNYLLVPRCSCIHTNNTVPVGGETASRISPWLKALNMSMEMVTGGAGGFFGVDTTHEDDTRSMDIRGSSAKDARRSTHPASSRRCEVQHQQYSPATTQYLGGATISMRQQRRANAAAALRRIQERGSRRFDSTLRSYARSTLHRGAAYRARPVDHTTFPPGLLYDRLQRRRCTNSHVCAALNLNPFACLVGSQWQCSDDTSLCCGGFSMQGSRWVGRLVAECDWYLGTLKRRCAIEAAIVAHARSGASPAAVWSTQQQQLMAELSAAATPAAVEPPSKRVTRLRGSGPARAASMPEVSSRAASPPPAAPSTSRSRSRLPPQLSLPLVSMAIIPIGCSPA